MTNCNCEELNALIKKVQQQERTIAQLVDVIANTNNKVSYLISKENMEQTIYKHT